MQFCLQNVVVISQDFTFTCSLVKILHLHAQIHCGVCVLTCTYFMSRYYLNKYSLELPEQRKSRKQLINRLPACSVYTKRLVLCLFSLMFQINESSSTGNRIFVLQNQEHSLLSQASVVLFCSQTYQLPP